MFEFVSLNVGNRNMNVYEFQQMNTKTQLNTLWTMRYYTAMNFMNTAGPQKESLMFLFLEEIRGELGDAGDYEIVLRICNQPTWSEMYEVIKNECPHFVAALNVETLKAGRPAPLEQPENLDVTRLADADQEMWFMELWREWLKDATRTKWQKLAKTRNLSVVTAVSGLFVFDYMSKRLVEAMYSSHHEKKTPFQLIQQHLQFSSLFPAMTGPGKYSRLASYLLDERSTPEVVFLQEAATLVEYDGVNCVDADLRPHLDRLRGPYLLFWATGRESVLLLKKDAFTYAEETTGWRKHVIDAGQAKYGRSSVTNKEDAKRLTKWQKNIEKTVVVRAVTAVSAASRTQRVMLIASAHCGHMDHTQFYLMALKDALDTYAGNEDIVTVVGADTNAAREDVLSFQDDLVDGGMLAGMVAIGKCTVAKTRTALQAQAAKDGKGDTSLKDYIFAWGKTTGPSKAALRQIRVPDLDADTVLLPNDVWPYDHASVVLTVDDVDDLLIPPRNPNSSFSFGCF